MQYEKRSFAIDILACPECGGRLRLVATIEDRSVIEKILAHVGLPVDPPSPAPARSPDWLPGLLFNVEQGNSGDWSD